MQGDREMIIRGMGLVAVCVVGLGATGGCRLLSGDWRAVSIEPRENAQALRAISFDRGGRYTATEAKEGEGTTTSGQYAWTGLKLRLIPDEGEGRSYGCRLGWDRSLILIDESTLIPVTVKFRRRR